MTRQRADRLLVDLGHFESRASARAAIEAGRVRVDGEILRKPSMAIDPDARIEAEAAHPYVSRGGLKLAHALDLWPDIRTQGASCIDIGASTGGFTDVLLQRGATQVLAIDVGTGQLHPRIAADPRVTSLEKTDARDLTACQVGAPDLLVCDASFIALEKLLGPVLALVDDRRACDLILLFKPQFQVGRDHVGRGGIVRDRIAAAEAESRFGDWLVTQGCIVKDSADSPIVGGDGNQERLIRAFKGI